MGEARRKQTATERLLAEYPYCCFCGGETLATTREHYPPKALFDKSFRPNELVVPACKSCNDLSRTADLVAAIASRWSFSELGPVESEDHRRLAARLRSQAPNIAAEWLKAASGVQQKRARRHLQKHGVPVGYADGYVTLGQETIPQLNLFAHKLALAVYFDETKICVPSEGLVSAHVRTKEDLIAKGLPDEVKEFLGEARSLKQGRLDTRQQFEYRTALSGDRKLFQVLARLRHGLVIAGWVVTNPKDAPEVDWNDWLRPGDLRSILSDPKFRRK